MQSYQYIFAFVAAMFMAIQPVSAQAPVINSIDREYGTVEEIVTLYGSGFGTEPTNVQVNFSAAIGEVVFFSESIIQVKVPAGATYESISVTRLDTKLTAYSTQYFTLSFDGQGFETSQLDGPYSFPTAGSDLYNLCMCDFNLDGKVDIATSDTGNDEITVLENTSPDINSVSFTERNFQISAKTRWVRCGDLNGDGLSDLIFSASNSNTNKDRIYIYQNITDPSLSSEIKFALPNPPISYTIDGTLAARMDMKDLDGDGKPEIVVTSISSGGGVSIYNNTSSGGNISFNPTPILPFQQFNVNEEKISGIDIEDLDGDGKLDIIVSEDEQSGVYIFKNSSSPGNISFNEHLEISTSGLTTNMRSGDLDGDGKPEIIIVNKSYVGIFKNTSTAGYLSFDDAIRFDQVSIGREGLELADMDGNGKLDILYASATGNRVVILLNQSSSSNLDLNTKKTILGIEGIQSVRAGDLNGDGKPDLAYAEVASDVVTVQLNRNCVKPVLEPQNGLGVCDLLPYQLTVTKAIGVTYQWESSADGNSFAPLAAAIDSTTSFTTENEAYYRVKMSSSHNGFDCNEIVSNVVQVVRPEGFVPDKPTIIDKNPVEPVCFGDRIILRAQNVNARFFWTGPDNFTSNEQNPVINNAIKTKEGWYSVYVQASEQDGNCKSAKDSTYIKVSEPETISITSNDPLVIFEGGQATLKVEAIAGSTYLWKKDGQIISGATSTTLNVSEAGSYTATIQNETGCTKESSPMEVAYAQFAIPESNCLNEALDISVSPTSINGKNIRYRWSFGDGNNSEEASTNHKYQLAGTYTVTLEILANDNSVKDTHSQEVRIIDIPALSISTPNGPNLCPDEQVELLANEGFATYSWDNGESGPNITVTEAGTYTLTAVTATNCTEMATVEVQEAYNPEVEIVASTDRISLGDTLQLNVQGAENSTTFLWSPASSLSDTTILNPIARPLVTTTYSCVVTNEEGCQTTLSYTLNVDRSLDVAPDKAFTPNGDGRHDTWYIEGMELFPDCKLTIFDRLGAKLYEVNDYSNANGWDGTINGRMLADGVYFYLINCGEEAGSKTGSVNIIR